MFRKELITQITYMYEFVIPHSIQIRQKQVRPEEIFVPLYQHILRAGEGCANPVERTQG